ncbi:MAG: hypothetical protein HY905_02950 [Deltaproteobacteria bacterium]|nr:hypothetical protein [Deltaproteobacteria bacterium]
MAPPTDKSEERVWLSWLEPARQMSPLKHVQREVRNPVSAAACIQAALLVEDCVALTPDQVLDHVAVRQFLASANRDGRTRTAIGELGQLGAIKFVARAKTIEQNVADNLRDELYWSSLSPQQNRQLRQARPADRRELLDAAHVKLCGVFVAALSEAVDAFGGYSPQEAGSIALGRAIQEVGLPDYEQIVRSWSGISRSRWDELTSRVYAAGRFDEVREVLKSLPKENTWLRALVSDVVSAGNCHRRARQASGGLLWHPASSQLYGMGKERREEKVRVSTIIAEMIRKALPKGWDKRHDRLAPVLPWNVIVTLRADESVGWREFRELMREETDPEDPDQIRRLVDAAEALLVAAAEKSEWGRDEKHQEQTFKQARLVMLLILAIAFGVGVPTAVAAQLPLLAEAASMLLQERTAGARGPKAALSRRLRIARRDLGLR